MSFKDKVVLITGASSGIGAGTAIKFASEGAKVAIVGRNETKLKNTTEKCEKNGSKPLVIIAELTNDKDVKRIVKDTVKHFGKLDVLVNNAGVNDLADITAENAIEIYDKVHATNMRAVVLLTNLAAPHLVKAKGNIINISSIAAMRAQAPGYFSYGSAKAALDQFTKCIALDLGPKGVRVNSVNPGPVYSDIMENSGRAELGEGAKYWDKYKPFTALGRVSEPEETAEVVLFLASDKAKSVTGACYITDNGMLLKSM